MMRVVALCFLLLATVLGFLHLDSHPAWAPFQIQELVSTDPESSHNSKAIVVQPKSDWLPDTGAASVHAASLITLKDGALRAFWFAGSREGAADVVINSAVFDPHTNTWGEPTVVIDRMTAEKSLARYIAKLGNPVPARAADGQLQLFFVTVSIGGWAGSSISTMSSADEGLTWSKPQRLITSPFTNLSTLVKTPAISFTDSRLGLPAYHEWIGKFGELLRIDGDQVIDKRRMSSGRSAIQPLVLIDGPEKAHAYFRQTRGGSQVHQIPVSETQNAGQSWQAQANLPIANPNAAITGVLLPSGLRVLVANDLESGRDRLVMLAQDHSAAQWQIIDVLEDDEALAPEQRREFSYPYIVANGAQVDLVYTWDRKKIRHIRFDAGWIQQAYSNAQAKSANSEEAK